MIVTGYRKTVKEKINISFDKARNIGYSIVKDKEVHHGKEKIKPLHR